ncbi:hypothetical protein BaRGS_00030857 [Batillaria attramentaria]|uniref:Uncharacterized protein n=1 Tax=Batillaria attramentaria TaxID=370345 RepID=A0ABD0JRX8_9CAEN
MSYHQLTYCLYRKAASSPLGVKLGHSGSRPHRVFPFKSVTNLDVTKGVKVKSPLFITYPFPVPHPSHYIQNTFIKSPIDANVLSPTDTLSRQEGRSLFGLRETETLLCGMFQTGALVLERKKKT